MVARVVEWGVAGWGIERGLRSEDHAGTRVAGSGRNWNKSVRVSEQKSLSFLLVQAANLRLSQLVRPAGKSYT